MPYFSAIPSRVVNSPSINSQHPVQNLALPTIRIYHQVEQQQGGDMEYRRWGPPYLTLKFSDKFY